MSLNLANECVGGAFFAGYSSRMLGCLGVDGGRYTMIGGFLLFGADFLALVMIGIIFLFYWW